MKIKFFSILFIPLFLFGHSDFIYDSCSNLTKKQSSEYTVSRTYDDRGRLIAISDSQNELVRYSYDDRDRLLVASFPSGKVGYSYVDSSHD